ncbi:MAG TPA: hypothetical protein VK084_06250, partial [Chitinophagaceae bacterium]|nr:hypothetical protein [Chitinophagaceae bacterium]
MFRRVLTCFIVLLLFPVLVFAQSPILIQTENTALVLQVKKNHLVQAYLGKILNGKEDYKNISPSFSSQA